jgi:hypothetical protein
MAPNVPLLTGPEVAGNLGNSPAGVAAKNAFCSTTACEAGIGAGVGILASAEDIFKGIKDSKDFCLNPAQAAGNTAINFFKNVGNIFGGLGDLFLGGKSPLDQMQKKVSNLNYQYQQNAQQYSQLFAQNQLKFDDKLVDTLKTMNKANSINTQFYFEMVSEKEELDRIYIIFLFIYIIIIIFYILIE